jgi:hypothetical protein
MPIADPRWPWGKEPYHEGYKWTTKLWQANEYVKHPEEYEVKHPEEYEVKWLGSTPLPPTPLEWLDLQINEICQLAGAV